MQALQKAVQALQMSLLQCHPRDVEVEAALVVWAPKLSAQVGQPRDEQVVVRLADAAPVQQKKRG